MSEVFRLPDGTYDDVDSGASPSDRIDVRADGAGSAGAINEGT